MKEFFKVLWKFAYPYKFYFILSLVFNVLSAALNVFSFVTIIPILQIVFNTEDAERATQLIEVTSNNLKEAIFNNVNYYISSSIERVGRPSTLLILGLVLIFLTLIKVFVQFLSSAIIIPMRTGVIRDIRNSLYRKVTSLPLSFFSKERKGDLIARITGDVNEIESSIMSSLDMLFKNPILIISYFITLVIVSWKLTLFTIVIAPLMIWLISKSGRTLKQSSLNAQSLWSETMTQVEETLSGLRIVKAFSAEEKMNKRFARKNDEHRQAIMRVNIRQQLAHPLSEFLGTVLIVIVLWFGSMLVIKANTLSASVFIYYLVILYSVINPLKEVSKAAYNIPKGMASVERVNKILKAKNNIIEKQCPQHISSFEREIEFKNVSFAYNLNNQGNQEPQWVLRNINLKIQKGKTIAFVGQSGGGKSTLVDLIPRFYDVQEGEVLIDGINVKDLAINDLRRLIGNVNQEAILFNDSFRNNITFGVDSATDEQVERASKIANAYEFIASSERGFNTNIGDRGSRLSGGQKQRVSIARAILKNPPILILDEATSALDTESERFVQEALERLMKTRTTVAIAHRLSTINRADEICVIHEGQIVERGTHEELMKKGGRYCKLYEMQVN